MKGYVARRELDGPKVYVVDEKQGGGLGRRELKQVVVHSPAGIEWGYQGSGPADLALSILADYFQENPTKQELYQGHFDIEEAEFLEADAKDQHAELMERKRLKCWRFHQDFKRAFVAQWPEEGGTVTDAQISDWLFQHERKGL